MTHVEQVLDAACSHISPQMQSIFLPQIKQVKAYPECKWTGVGTVFRIDSERARGWYWAYVPFEGCLISRMSWLALASFSLEEKPVQDYVCIGTMQTQELALMSEIWERIGSPQPYAHINEESLEALAQDMPHITMSFPCCAGSYQFEIEEQTVYSSATVCLTQECLADFSKRFGELWDTIQLLSKCPLALNENNKVKKMFSRLLPSSFSRQMPQVDAYAQILNMLAALADSGTHTLKTDLGMITPLTTTRPIKRFSQAVVTFLQESLSCPPTLDELARTFHIGRTTLCTRFKAEQGKSIGEALTELRVKKIEEALLCGKTLHEIASELGYTSESSVRGIFVRQKGMSPRDWLKQQGR
ncbi:AraC family transcriptional regulator [Atopobium fossor]|uniref:AraC family transcriptional regulator n=1 Tax=Atopobium fossor TaxID=39487 RepID=UPI0004161FE2|nr:AraC family transcriptional regulator [Atopobium fossor]